ncbi:YihY/virulence factor BrkB family protein [Promineifilum sp.]|uniref:YihY/virulence factor BrkB family protein n=1 Tax=Promineifilum sp. TaxID=2664178 RepID=UPI0035B0B65A
MIVKFIDLLIQTFKDWSEDKASRLAAALAYYTVFSIPPLLVVAIGIASLFTDRATIETQVVNQASSLMGQQGGEAIQTILQSAEEPGDGELLPTLFGVALLIFGASGVFTQLQDAMNTIWEVRPDPKRGFLSKIKDRFFSFSMVLVIGFILLVSLMLSTVLAAFGGYVGGLVSDAEILLWILNFIISFGVYTLLFALMFKTIPDVEMTWRDVLVGAALTAVLFKLGEYALSFYFERSDPTSAFGAAGSIILLLLWVYYSAQILFFGAEFTEVYTKEYGSGMRPQPGAIPVTEEARAQQGIPHREHVDQSRRAHKAAQRH